MQVLIETIWGTALRKFVTTLAVFISSVAGAIVAVPPAWSTMGLPIFATRAWAELEIRHPIKLAQAQTQKQIIDLQLDIAMGKLDQLDNNRAALEIEKLKTPIDEIKTKADAQIRKIDRDTQALTDQIRTLQGLRGAAPQP